MEITLEISQNAVLAEVEQKTNYAGSKREENPKEKDEGAYERIRTIDEDQPELLMFWDECRTELVETMGGKLVTEGMGSGEESDRYQLTLNVADGFNTALLEGMRLNLFFFYVYGIISRWFLLANREEAAAYAAISMENLGKMQSNSLQRAFLRKTFLP